jgi:rare lipoprotein A
MLQSLLFLCLCFAGAVTGFAQLPEAPSLELYGSASYYAGRFEGRRTASGATFKHDSLTAAHKSLPLGTRVKVTNRENQKSVEVIINDRMSKRSPHIIDLSKAGARELGFLNQGFALVSIEVIPSLPYPNNITNFNP